MKGPRPVSQRAHCLGPVHVTGTTRYTALGQAHRGRQTSSLKGAVCAFVSSVHMEERLLPNPS